MAAADSPYLTLTEACAYLKRSRGWFRQHAEQIGVYRESGRVYFRRSDLDAWRERSYMRPSSLDPDPKASRPKPASPETDEINGFTGVRVGAYTGRSA